MNLWAWYIWDKWLMSSFTYIVIQEYLSRSRQKVCAFYFLDQSCVLQTFLRNSWNCIAWRLNILMNTVRLEHKSFRPIFGLLLSTVVDIVSLFFFTHAKFWHQHKNKVRNFDCNFILTSALTFLFLWQWGQYARVLPHFIYQHCPCCSLRDYILIS